MSKENEEKSVEDILREEFDEDTRYLELWNENTMKNFKKLYKIQNPDEEKSVEDILRELFDEKIYFRTEIEWHDNNRITLKTSPHNGYSVRIDSHDKDPIKALRKAHEKLTEYWEKLKNE